MPALRALHAQLCRNGAGTGARGALLPVRACATPDAEGLPPTLTRSLLHPPPLALVVDAQELSLDFQVGLSS
jgi:hypothetical protein